MALLTLLAVAAALFVLACSKNTTEPVLGEKYIESQTGLTVNFGGFGNNVLSFVLRRV